jgi:hypothetical protein
MVLRFSTTEDPSTRLELHTPVVNQNSRFHPYAIQTSRPHRIVYPDENRERIIITIELCTPAVNTFIDSRYQGLEQEMAQFMPAATSIKHVDFNSALEFAYPAAANVVIAGYQDVTKLYLNFDRRGNNIPIELESIRCLNRLGF